MKKPIGTPISAASNSSFALPTIAFAMPPPTSPTGLGNWVKKSKLMDRAPFQTRKPRMNTSTETATKAHNPAAPNMNRFTALRHR